MTLEIYLQQTSWIYLSREPKEKQENKPKSQGQFLVEHTCQIVF